MSEESDTSTTDVALTRGENPSEALLKGFDHLGGISKFIQKNDLVFIKISFKQPYGFPTNINYETLGKLINLCREAGAKDIYVGDFPSEDINSEILSEITGLSKYVESNNAKVAHLDNEEQFPRSKISRNDIHLELPTLILEADKLIILNQVNVHPVFMSTLAYLNLSTIVPNKYQKIQKKERSGKDFLYLDQYKQDLIANILAISEIKPPNLVINDLFYVLERAGPLIYKDSHCKQNNSLIIGENIFAVDYITLKLMGIELSESKLLLEAQDYPTGIHNTKSINVIGGRISEERFKIQRCVSNLNDINVKNCFIGKGNYCSGCYEVAYHLLNFFKSSMVKDLKYIGPFSFLIGEAPSKPDIKDNIILFGDCAIKSTTDSDFRKITLQKKNSKNIIKKLNKSHKNSSSKPLKVKIVDNKHILELSGCPPDLNKSYDILIKYYGKSNVSNLKLLNMINRCYIDNDT